MSARRRIAALVCWIALAGLVAGCGLIPGFGAPAARPVGVEVSNGTDLDVTLVVNGKVNCQAAWCYLQTSAEARHIQHYIAFWHGVTVVP